MFVEHLFYF